MYDNYIKYALPLFPPSTCHLGSSHSPQPPPRTHSLTHSLNSRAQPRETIFEYPETSMLSRCDLDRPGGPGGPSAAGRMLLVNHWAQKTILAEGILVPKRRSAAATNARARILEHAERCVERIPDGRGVSFVLVSPSETSPAAIRWGTDKPPQLDWIHKGDAMDAQRVLNGL